MKKKPNFLLHYDLYRLPELSENPQHTAAEIGLEEALQNPENLIVIEWADRLPITQEALSLQFEKKEDHHLITLRKNTFP